MVTVEIPLDDQTKAELDAFCEEVGLDLESFFMVYVKKVLRDRRIPFELSAPKREQKG